jgi:hypothetical protein
MPESSAAEKTDAKIPPLSERGAEKPAPAPKLKKPLRGVRILQRKYVSPTETMVIFGAGTAQGVKEKMDGYLNHKTRGVAFSIHWADANNCAAYLPLSNPEVEMVISDGGNAVIGEKRPRK